MRFKQLFKSTALCVVLLFLALFCAAQADPGPPPGITELHDAREQVYQDVLYLEDTAILLGSIFGLVGGVRVYTNWQLGKQQIDAQIIGWFGACIFLELMAVFVDALYGV